MSQKPQPKPAPKQPVVLPPADVVVAHFTRAELAHVRGILRDSDSERAVRVLDGAVTRAGGSR